MPGQGRGNGVDPDSIDVALAAGEAEGAGGIQVEEPPLTCGDEFE